MDYTNRWPDPQHPPNPNLSATDPYAQYSQQQILYQQYELSSSSSYPHYAQYHPQNPTTATTAQTPSSQTYASPSSNAALGPPGADSYAGLSSYHPTHLAYAPQLPALCYQDPAAAPHPSWSVNVKEAIRHYGADPVAYAPGVESYTDSVLPAVPMNGISHPLSNEVNTQTKAVQSMRCEVCRIVCNSKDVYDHHLLGKKHKTNLLQHSLAPAIASMPSGLPVGSDLERKRQKLVNGGGSSVDSVLACALCNVVCNSQEAFHKHLAGRKHAVQAGTIPPNRMVSSGSAHPVWTNPVVQPTFSNAVKRGGPKKRKIVQSAWCEVCKCDCTSKEVLDQHKLGKKHKKNLEKLEESKTKANPTVAAQTVKKTVIGPQEIPSATKGKSKKKPGAELVEDLETKRRKIMEGGAAADAVRVCQACNVVCNSETVFKYHLAGQKHAANVKKTEVGNTATASGHLAIPAA